MRFPLRAVVPVLAGLLVAVRAADPAAGPLLAEADLPAYERNLDHAGLIRAWNPAARARGERVYQLVCHACHGDFNLPGSLPDAPRFGEHTFTRGADPLALYATLTRGWGRMPPQTGLTPREKYDVIHYLRETFLAGRGPAVRPPVDDAYLAALPPGRERGPEPVRREPWREMDYGSYLIGTYELADEARRTAAAGLKGQQLDQVAPRANLAQKGIAIRLDRGPGGVAAGRAWVVFEHDTLRLAGGWTGEGFIDWEGINFNGRHVVRPRTVGTLHFETADAPGWGDPATGRFDDRRIVGVDGRRFGPLPREWMRYRGLHRPAERVVLEYEVGGTVVLETHDLEGSPAQPVFVRTLNVARSARDLLLRVADEGAVVGLRGGPGLELGRGEGFVTLRIPAGATPVRLALRLARPGSPVPAAAGEPAELAPFLAGGPSRWPEELAAAVVASPAGGAFAWERLSLPADNPWRARVRPGGFDFAPGATEAFVCTWDGDVWRVTGLGDSTGTVRWRRIAAGLFQPLGVRVRDGEVFVTCRDQLVRLHDRDGDGEADFLESFNSDHQVTEHFHEFAMGLQTDAAGNFYYAKSARHARTALVPHHGTLLKVSADGRGTEILANGFRAANGVCLNPDGSFYVTDQEGHWMPMNRINRVVPGRFYGNQWSHGAPADASDAAMAPPVCWIDKAFDRSPAELIAVNGRGWERWAGTHLNLSYGVGRLEVLISEPGGGESQGAVCALPVPDFPTGIMRARFHPGSGDLYLAGLSAWATSQTLQEGGFYRLRPTGRPALLPVGWHIRADGVDLTFSDPPGAVAAADFTVRAWDLRRSASYGSPRLNERTWPVVAAVSAEDPRGVRLVIPGLVPAQVVELTCRLRDVDGREVVRVIAGTVHRVPGRVAAAP
jgi:mono/diheme cytochrome c family protein